MNHEIYTCLTCGTLTEKLEKVEEMLFEISLFNDLEFKPKGYSEWLRKQYLKQCNPKNATEWSEEND